MARLAELPVRVDVYGDGPYRPQIEAAIARHDMGHRVRLHGRVRLEELPRILAGSDLGLVPSLPEPYMQLSLSTKLLELVAMGVPVIASDLATFRVHFDEGAIRYVRGGDPAALADGIRADAADRVGTVARAAEARRQAAAYAWSAQAATYLQIVEDLAGRR